MLIRSGYSLRYQLCQRSPASQPMTPKRPATKSDLRTFFRQRRRVVPSKEIGGERKPKQEEDPAVKRNPLYIAPPGLGELAFDFDIRSEGETSRSISCYQRMVNSNPEKYYDEEKFKLTSLMKDICILDFEIPKEATTIALRLVRKLLQEELHRISDLKDEEDCDVSGLKDESYKVSEMKASVEKWIVSEGFWTGIMNICNIIESRKLIVNSDGGGSLWALFMLIEPVVKAEPLLSIDPVISHLLTNQERQLLLHTIWQEDSIYTLLRGEKAPPITRRRRTSTSSPGKALHAITHPVPAGVTPLEFFFRKFLRVAASVIEHLIVSLELSLQVRQSSWTLFMGAIEDELGLRMMDKRNLLTVMACTVYSTAKLFDEDRSFSQIISALQRQYPTLGEDWFRSVPLEDPQNQSDLVVFYNTIYLEKMRGRIYALKELPRTPVKDPSSTPFPKALGSVAISRNITLDVSPGPLKRTTGTPVCVAILGSLGACRTGNSPTNKVARRLHF